MSFGGRGAIQTRDLLMSLLAGAVITGVSIIPYSIPERDASAYMAIPLAVISAMFMPVALLSMFLFRHFHDPNFIPAASINTLFYGGLTLGLTAWRHKKHLVSKKTTVELDR